MSVQTVQKEVNYNIISDNIDIYPEDYSFPIKTGDIFPDNKLKNRADRSFTNRLLFKNDYEKVFSMYLTTIPEIDPTYGMQIRDITSQLPFFYKTVSGFLGLTIGNGVLFDFADIEDNSCDIVLEHSNIKDALKSIIEGDFMDPCNLYKVALDNLGNPCVQVIPVKNFIIYNDPKYINSIYSYLTFSVIDNKIEFIEYIYNGKIRKRTFAYDGSAIGAQIGDIEETEAFGGKYKEAPLVLFKNNVLEIGDTYGNDRFSMFDSAVLAVCKSYMNLLRLNEKCKEMIRKVPESAIQRNSNIGGVYINRGVISYNDNTDPAQRPDVEYIIPQLKENIEASISELKESVKILAMASGLSHVFYDFEKAGSGTLSGNALKTMMMPTLIETNKIVEDKEKGVKELAHKILLLKDIDISVSHIDVDFNQGLPRDDMETVNYVTERLNNKTITLVDAIRKLDKVTLRVAKQQASEILGLAQNTVSASDNIVNLEADNNETSDLNFNIKVNEDEQSSGKSDAIPDCQMPIQPRDYAM